MKAMVLFSGGVDSTTCLGIAVDRYGADEVLALSISYGQKHQKEIEAAGKIAAYYGVTWKQLDLSIIFANSNCSLLTGSTEEIPQESYAEQLSHTNGKPVSTYVPFRNVCFWHRQQVLPCLTAVRSSSMAHTVMTLPATPIRIAAMHSIRQ